MIFTQFPYLLILPSTCNHSRTRGGLEGMSVHFRANPPRAARPSGSLLEFSDADEESSRGSREESPFFTPSDANRGCPTCRKIPSGTLRIFPEVFKCPVCLSDEIVDVYVFVNCGHCICLDCKDMWLPDTTQDDTDILQNIGSMTLTDDESPDESPVATSTPSRQRGRPLTSPSLRTAEATRRRKYKILTSIENWKFNNGMIVDAIFYCDVVKMFESPDGETRDEFRSRLCFAVNVGSRLGTTMYGRGWVGALSLISTSCVGVNPLKFSNYVITIMYVQDDTQLSLSLVRIKGLSSSELIDSFNIEDEKNIKHESGDTSPEHVSYFLDNFCSPSTKILEE